MQILLVNQASSNLQGLHFWAVFAMGIANAHQCWPSKIPISDLSSFDRAREPQEIHFCHKCALPVSLKENEIGSVMFLCLNEQAAFAAWATEAAIPVFLQS